jgi:hypothetical protein
LGVFMKKLVIVFAALAAISLTVAPATFAAEPAKAKTLWEGWRADVKKLSDDISAKWKARMEKK